MNGNFRKNCEAEKAGETTERTVEAALIETAEKATETDDLDCSSSTPRSERSVPSSSHVSSRVKDDPEKLLQWGRKYKVRAEQLREELDATKEKIVQWKNDNSYLKRVVEKHQASITQLGDKLRQEEAAKTAALAQLQVKCLKINELEGSVTTLQHQLEFEEHSVAASRQRFDEANVEFMQQMAVKESIIAKLLLEKEALGAQAKADVALQAPTVSSSRSHSSDRHGPSAEAQLLAESPHRLKRRSPERHFEKAEPRPQQTRRISLKKPVGPAFVPSHVPGPPHFRDRIKRFKKDPHWSHSKHPSFPSPDREQAGTSNMTSAEAAALRIDHLDTKVTNDAMSRVLAPFGPLKNCYLSFGTDGSTKTAFVEFVRDQDARNAMRVLDGSMIQGRKVTVSIDNRS